MPAVFADDAVALGALLTFALLYSLALAAKYTLQPIFHVINDALGWVPFVGGWVESATAKVITYIDEGVTSSRHAMSTALMLFFFAIYLTAAGIVELGKYLEQSLVHNFTTAIPQAFSNLWSDVNVLTRGLGGRIDSLTATVAADLTTAEHYADRVAAGALSTAEGYTDAVATKLHTTIDKRISSVYSSVETDIASAAATALATAESYTDQVRRAIEAELAKAIAGVESDLGAAVNKVEADIGAVSSRLTSVASTLETELASAEAAGAEALAEQVKGLLGDIATAKQQAEDAATAAITSTAAGLTAAINSAEAAGQAALGAAEGTLNASISSASAAEATALSSAVGTLESSIAGVRAEADAIAGQVAAAGAAAAGELADIYNLPADAIRSLLDQLDVRDLAAFGAGVVLLRGYLESVLAESGLGSASCRGLNKQICGVSPRAWGDLLSLAADFVLLTDLCAILPLLEEGFSVVASPLIAALTAVGAGLCSADSAAPADLPSLDLALPGDQLATLEIAA